MEGARGNEFRPASGTFSVAFGCLKVRCQTCTFHSHNRQNFDDARSHRISLILFIDTLLCMSFHLQHDLPLHRAHPTQPCIANVTFSRLQLLSHKVYIRWALSKPLFCSIDFRAVPIRVWQDVGKSTKVWRNCLDDGFTQYQLGLTFRNLLNSHRLVDWIPSSSARFNLFAGLWHGSSEDFAGNAPRKLVHRKPSSCVWPPWLAGKWNLFWHRKLWECYTKQWSSRQVANKHD